MGHSHSLNSPNLVRENCPIPLRQSSVFPLITIIFKLIQHINKTNVLTKFHDDWPKNVTLRKNLLTTCHEDWAKNKTAPPLGGHVFSLIKSIFKLKQDIKKTNILTKFHDDWTKNVTSRVKKTPPPGGHETNALTIFHNDWAKMCPLDCAHKSALPLGGHVFSLIMTIFELVRDIYKIDAKNVTSRVITSFFYYINIRKPPPPPPPSAHVFLPIQTIVKLNRRIQEINVLTKFHEYLTQNVTSRRKLPRPLAAMFFHRPGPVSNETNVLTRFHDDWAKIVTSRVFTRNTALLHGGHVFQMTETIFELIQQIIKTNILTKLHEDWASNVTSTVFTWFFSCPTFKLIRGIIRTNVLITFHEDRTINVASRVFTGQMLTSDGQQTKGDHKSSP
ncbi:hypothetical protein DPMN_073639 [Dreissena polymorpha]|uniref:Uncharacterized protein n=1 Tax=Dreissena polymorpha TaxID=45954 RepID=A0A9D4BZG5_DREPO|nr:hypothetical protein DPMN_073639 [Dreissena polymorpha]